MPALKLLKVEWKQRAFVLDPEDGLKSSAPIANPESSPQTTYIETHG